MQRILERHKRGKAYVISLILRPCDWRASPFADLQYLPRNGKAVTTWNPPDTAFANIARSIRLVCDELMQSNARHTLQKSSPIPLQIYKLSDVFVKADTPTVTFVEPTDFEALKHSLAQLGSGVVIEGPSGIGKTTAVKKAIEYLENLEENVARVRKRRRVPKKIELLSAHNTDHRDRLQTLRLWHQNVVIIDDFHRLDPALRQDLVDYLKYLADIGSKSQKLVIVGIPQTGQTLVDTSFDVATRIDVFRLGHVSDELINQMIEKGEVALNIHFDRKTDIVLANQWQS